MEKTIEIPEGYEAALERCKQWVAGTSGLNPGASPKEVSEYIFPELAESEDEKIRKDIIAFLQSMNSHCNPTQDWDLRNRWLPYLERQKPIYNLEISAGDVAPAEEDGPFDEDEFLENELSAFLQNYDKEYDDDAAVSDVAKHFYEIGKKAAQEQKPSTPEDIAAAYQMGLAEGRKEQKPAEDRDAIEPTPKQDYSGLTDFERAIHRGFLCAGVENVPVGIIKDTAQDCLAHIKPAEWSEEDEKMIDNIDKSLSSFKLGKHYIEQKQIEAERKWLKSLRPQPKQKRHLGEKDQWCCSAAWAAVRDSDAYNGEEKQFILDFLQRCEPQPHWKPSEYQMQGLRRGIVKAEEGSDAQNAMKSLYEDLKKL